MHVSLRSIYQVRYPHVPPLDTITRLLFLQAYCTNFGMNWWERSGLTADNKGFFHVPVTLSPALCWLLDRAGFESLKEPLGKHMGGYGCQYLLSKV